MVVDFDPVLLSLGPLQIRYYGLMYVIAFLIGGYLLKRLSLRGYFKNPADKVDTFITYLLIGMFIGARLVYVFVYNFDGLMQNPQELFSVWKGGLSFHGGLIGMAIGGYLYSRKYKLLFWNTFDSCTLAGAQGLFFGRLGNFINGELYGRATDMPWGLIFPSGGPLPRHPSQLYEGVFEGIILSLILWSQHKRIKKPGTLTAIFIFGYGVFRYSIEFFREADSQMGYYFWGTTTMGQILCLSMIVVGILVFVFTRKLKEIEV